MLVPHVVLTSIDINFLKFKHYLIRGQEASEELVFCMKELKAMIGLCEAAELQDLTFQFTGNGMPVKFSCIHSAFTASLIIATLFQRDSDTQEAALADDPAPEPSAYRNSFEDRDALMQGSDRTRENATNPDESNGSAHEESSRNAARNTESSSRISRESPRHRLKMNDPGEKSRTSSSAAVDYDSEAELNEVAPHMIAKALPSSLHSSSSQQGRIYSRDERGEHGSGSGNGNSDGNRSCDGSSESDATAVQLHQDRGHRREPGGNVSNFNGTSRVQLGSSLNSGDTEITINNLNAMSDCSDGRTNRGIQANASRLASNRKRQKPFFDSDED